MAVTEKEHRFSLYWRGGREHGSICFRLQRKIEKASTTVAVIAQQQRTSSTHLKKNDSYCLVYLRIGHQLKECPVVTLPEKAIFPNSLTTIRAISMKKEGNTLSKMVSILSRPKQHSVSFLYRADSCARTQD